MCTIFSLKDDTIRKFQRSYLYLNKIRYMLYAPYMLTAIDLIQ